jgi:hypothetical protein
LGSLPVVKTILVLALVLALPSTAGATTLVSFSQSGGIAGRHVAMTVSTGGRARVSARTRHTTHTLRASTLRNLRRLLANARFDRVHPGGTNCADCFVYAVRYRGQRISYDDSQAKNVPRSVRMVVDELARIARGGR